MKTGWIIFFILFLLEHFTSMKWIWLVCFGILAFDAVAVEFFAWYIKRRKK